MAPPKKPNGPMVRRMIQLEPDDVERLARVTERLGEGSDASTIRRLIREADAVPVTVALVDGFTGKVVRVTRSGNAPVVRMGAPVFKPHPKPNAGKTTKGRK